MIEIVVFCVGIAVGGWFFSEDPVVVEKEKIRYVDIETYKTWGTTRMVPIGVRPVPTEEELSREGPWRKRDVQRRQR